MHDHAKRAEVAARAPAAARSGAAVKPAPLAPPSSIPPVAAQLAQECRTETAAYLSEAPVMSTYALEDRTVYLTYSTTARGLEFTMGYYGFLDRAPLGRNEGRAA
jgi:predicted dithiol-disulfide oxidoreductase (DUF899 family)